MTVGLLRPEALRDTLLTTLDLATRAGATAADAVALHDVRFRATVRMGEVEALTDARQQRLGLRVFVGQRSAVGATADLKRGSLARFAADTVALARATQPDPAAGLPEPSLLAREAPDLDLYDPTAEIPAPEASVGRARAAEAAALGADARLTNSEGAEFTQEAAILGYASTLGFDGGYRRSSFRLSVNPVASVDGRMQGDYWYTSARHLDRLDDAETVGRRAADRVLRRLAARRVTTQEAPVVFEAEVAASLLGHLATALVGQSLYRGASFLLGRLGDAIASPLVTVIDDGRRTGGLGSRPFDAEGLPTRHTVVVDGGRLVSYLLDTYAARRLGLNATGNAARGVGEVPSALPTNFYLAAGMHSPEEIVASVDRGLLVTQLVGVGMNPVTGDYSRGAVGLWIEHGRVAFPVEEITIAGNLLDMLRDIEMVGNDLAFRRSIAAPTLKVRRMTIAGA